MCKHRGSRSNLRLVRQYKGEKAVGTRTVAMQAKMCQTLRRDQQLTVKTIQNKENSAKTQSKGSSPFTMPPNKRAKQRN